VGGPQINSANRKIRNLACGLTKFAGFVNLPDMVQFADLQFADPIFCDLQISDLLTKFFANLELPQIRENIIFILINIGFK
jgi:hypothetical protein